MKKRVLGILLAAILLTGLFSSCRFESAAEHESRLDGADFSRTASGETDSDGVVLTETQTASMLAGEETGTSVQSGKNDTAVTQKNSTSAASGGQSATLPAGGGQTTPPSASVPPAHDETTSRENIPKEIVVTLAIHCDNAVGHADLKEGIVLPQDGAILNTVTLTVQEGQTVFDALKIVTGGQKIYLGYSGSGASAYVNRIGPIGEKECGKYSGWTYLVNGVKPSKAAGSYVLKKGDIIEWRYVTTY